MGCLKSRDTEYDEILVSDGNPSRVNFKARNRRIVSAWTYDKDLTFVYDHDSIFMHGAAGASVFVKYVIY